MGWLVVPKQKNKAQAMLGFRKVKTVMQPYQHIRVSGNRGVLTVCTTRPHEEFVVLGASCQTSVNNADGAVLSFVLVPKNVVETVAVAVIDGIKIVEAFLLKVTLNNGKAEIDLNVPYGGSPRMIGQMITKEIYCILRGINNEDGEIISESWFVAGLKDKEKQADGRKFDELCKMLVEADAAKIITIDVVMDDSTVKFLRALCVGPINEEREGDFFRMVSICPGQGLDLDHTLEASWIPDSRRWVVIHHSNT